MEIANYQTNWIFMDCIQITRCYIRHTKLCDCGRIEWWIFYPFCVCQLEKHFNCELGHINEQFLLQFQFNFFFFSFFFSFSSFNFDLNDMPSIQIEIDELINLRMWKWSGKILKIIIHLFFECIFSFVCWCINITKSFHLFKLKIDFFFRDHFPRNDGRKCEKKLLWILNLNYVWHMVHIVFAVVWVYKFWLKYKLKLIYIFLNVYCKLIGIGQPLPSSFLRLFFWRFASYSIWYQ